ncbi:hypothetical protein TGDOM2_255715 [Toxoplasma gondii GAB2-2007-GAL-DOM2]|uniref:Uncharacterized protein n=6 Tax=Toxoplasma gondii TaxID=5811 RepID=S7V1Y8_TOXGG|nr:hypothetical protein TGGT1_255715 [Toxoplasma gondii GT1]KAF4641521.1 hypothetical protein TGRH88_073310 [Toxoplasma gondii]KFG30003.1 hypothetical protein TGDOM2_255715 [Toxoplasma gondii GAB2-2007-GAL-DOM2]KFG37084.1 hypothetical protein TGFOU_255715 [Toxoplasma gondii FOU]PUA85802.1 hypothetical protein TGBR9_255715 [Toxoplasma gondii TgCATBr9]RQX68145.1 hypothetical protein TGCAST_255715 [Toxoplasma gondii CAST]
MGWITSTLKDLRQYWDAVLPSDATCYTRCRHFLTEASLDSPAPPPGTFAGCSTSSRAWWSELRPGRSNYTAGTFCNNGCGGLNTDNVVSCRESCKVFCFGDVVEAKGSGADRGFWEQAPADPEVRKICVEACTFGCNAREELGLFPGNAGTTHASNKEAKSSKTGNNDVHS